MTVKFLDKEYTQESLGTLSVEQLLELRNLVASNLGVQAVKGFKDHDTAVAQTWKALEKYQSTVAAEADGKPAEKPAKAKKEPKPRGMAKPAQAQVVKRPTRKMFSTIRKLKDEPPADAGRTFRWPNYKDGMTLVDIIETDGCVPWDAYNWAKQGLMEITEPTDEEYEQRRAAWYKKHGREDPEAAKERQAKEKAEAAEKRKAEAEAKRKAKEAEKAAKAAEQAPASA